MRVRTVERDKQGGWIARDPATGLEIWHNFRWASRSVARAVVAEARALAAQAAAKGEHDAAD